MNQMIAENCSIVSPKESLSEFGIDAQQAGFLPSIILTEIYRGKSGKVFYPVYTQQAIALQWALDQIPVCIAMHHESVEANIVSDPKMLVNKWI